MKNIKICSKFAKKLLRIRNLSNLWINQVTKEKKRSYFLEDFPITFFQFMDCYMCKTSKVYFSYLAHVVASINLHSVIGEASVIFSTREGRCLITNLRGSLCNLPLIQEIKEKFVDKI